MLRSERHLLRMGCSGVWLAVPTLAAEEGSLFNADVGNFVFSLLVFGLVVAILGRFAWKPLLTVLNARERSIREALETARQEREAAALLLKQYQEQLARAREQAAAIVEEGRRDGEAVRQRIQAEARQQAEEMLARARREIRLATEAAIKELFDRTAELAVQVAGRVLRKGLSSQGHRELIAESLAEIEKAVASRLN